MRYWMVWKMFAALRQMRSTLLEHPTPASSGRSGKGRAENDGIEIKSFGSNDVHKPTHAHVKAVGKEVRIGPNGKPIKDQLELI